MYEEYCFSTPFSRSMFLFVFSPERHPSFVNAWLEVKLYKCPTSRAASSSQCRVIQINNCNLLISSLLKFLDDFQKMRGFSFVDKIGNLD